MQRARTSHELLDPATDTLDLVEIDGIYVCEKRFRELFSGHLQIVEAMAIQIVRKPKYLLNEWVRPPIVIRKRSSLTFYGFINSHLPPNR